MRSSAVALFPSQYPHSIGLQDLWVPYIALEDLQVPDESYQIAHMKRTGEQVQLREAGTVTKLQYKELQAEYERSTSGVRTPGVSLFPLVVTTHTSLFSSINFVFFLRDTFRAVLFLFLVLGLFIQQCYGFSTSLSLVKFFAERRGMIND